MAKSNSSATSSARLYVDPFVLGAEQRRLCLRPFFQPSAACLCTIWQIALPAAKYTPVGPPVPMATKRFVAASASMVGDRIKLKQIEMATVPTLFKMWTCKSLCSHCPNCVVRPSGKCNMSFWSFASPVYCVDPTEPDRRRQR